MSNGLLFGLPLAAYGGMVVFALLLVQVLGGLRVVKISPVWHKRLGIIILGLAAFHGLVGILYFLG